MNIDENRLNRVLSIPLLVGPHEPPNGGMEACVMEAVAYVAGEPWSDKPKCCCPVIGAFMRSWNDALPSEADRDRLLKPFISKLIGTAAGPKTEERRAYLALDWLIRVNTPRWLDLRPELNPHAKALRDLEEIADMAGAQAAGEKVHAAWDAAWDARDAARDAAGAAAWDAAGAAAWDAAWDAARAAAGAAAWAAAWDAAWDAARAAAWAAAWAAARDAARAAAGDAAGAAAHKKLQPTIEWLQVSAIDLVERMIAVQE